MGRLSTAQKAEIEARVLTFNFLGLDMKLGYNLCCHFKSFVGRDFKALAQVVLFILGPYMTPEEKSVWLALSKVCYYAGTYGNQHVFYWIFTMPCVINYCT